jgi:hypothetical protein
MVTPKDPARVRTGRLGGLTTAARGHHNLGPAREAFLRRFEPDDPALTPEEREKRRRAGLRLHMSRLASARWAARKAAS